MARDKRPGNELNDGKWFGQIDFRRDIYVDPRLADISAHKLKSQADISRIFTCIQTIGIRQQLRQWLNLIFQCLCQHLTQLTANKSCYVVSDFIFLVA